MDKPYKRRNYFIDRYFQGRFILLFTLLTFLGGIISIAIFNILTYRKVERLVYSIHIPIQGLSDFFLTELILSNILAFVFMVLAVYISIRRLVKRVSGPLYRIKRDIEIIKGGDLSFNITLRFKDEFKEFAGHLNNMIETHRRLYAGLNSEIETIDRFIREIERHHREHDRLFMKNRQIMSSVESMKDRFKELKI